MSLRGYLSKRARGNELIAAVTAVAAGETVLSPAIAGQVLFSASSRDSGPSLTARELEMLTSTHPRPDLTERNHRQSNSSLKRSRTHTNMRQMPEEVAAKRMPWSWLSARSATLPR